MGVSRLETLLPKFTDIDYGQIWLELAREAIAKPLGQRVKKSRPGSPSGSSRSSSMSADKVKRKLNQYRINSFYDRLIHIIGSGREVGRLDAGKLERISYKFFRLNFKYHHHYSNTNFYLNILQHYIESFEMALYDHAQLSALTKRYFQSLKAKGNEGVRSITALQKSWMTEVAELYAKYNTRQQRSLIITIFDLLQKQFANKLDEIKDDSDRVVSALRVEVDDKFFDDIAKEVERSTQRDRQEIPELVQWIQTKQYQTRWHYAHSDKYSARERVRDSFLKLLEHRGLLDKPDLLAEVDRIRSVYEDVNRETRLVLFTDLVALKISLLNNPDLDDKVIRIVDDIRTLLVQRDLHVIGDDNVTQDDLDDREPGEDEKSVIAGDMLLNLYSKLKRYQWSLDSDSDAADAIIDFTNNLHKQFLGARELEGLIIDTSPRRGSLSLDDDTKSITDADPFSPITNWMRLYVHIATGYYETRADNKPVILECLQTLLSQFLLRDIISLDNISTIITNFPSDMSWGAVLTDRDTVIPTIVMQRMLEAFQTATAKEQIECLRILIEREKTTNIIIPELAQCVSSLNLEDMDYNHTSNINNLLEAHNDFLRERQVFWLWRIIHWIINLVLNRSEDYYEQEAIPYKEVDKGRWETTLSRSDSSHDLKVGIKQPLVGLDIKNLRDDFIKRADELARGKIENIGRIISEHQSAFGTQTNLINEDLKRASDDFYQLDQKFVQLRQLCALIKTQIPNSQLSPNERTVIDAIQNVNEQVMTQKVKAQVILSSGGNTNLANFYMKFVPAIADTLIEARLAYNGRFRLSMSSTASNLTKIFRVGGILCPLPISLLCSLGSMLVEHYDAKMTKAQDKKIAHIFLTRTDVDRFAECLATEITFRWQTQLLALTDESLIKTFKFIFNKAIFLLTEKGSRIMPDQYDPQAAVDNMLYYIAQPLPRSIPHRRLRDNLKFNRTLYYIKPNGHRGKWDADELLFGPALQYMGVVYTHEGNDNARLVRRYGQRSTSEHELKHFIDRDHVVPDQSCLQGVIAPLTTTEITKHLEAAPPVAILSPIASPVKGGVIEYPLAAQLGTLLNNLKSLLFHLKPQYLTSLRTTLSNLQLHAYRTEFVGKNIKKELKRLQSSLVPTEVKRRSQRALFVDNNDLISKDKMPLSPRRRRPQSKPSTIQIPLDINELNVLIKDQSQRAKDSHTTANDIDKSEFLLLNTLYHFITQYQGNGNCIQAFNEACSVNGITFFAVPVASSTNQSPKFL